MPLSNLAIRDIETLAHPNTNLALLCETGPLVIERGKGVFVYDSDGKAYLEGMAGLWCTALGYGNEELAETAAAEMKKLGFGHLYNGKSHDPAIEARREGSRRWRRCRSQKCSSATPARRRTTLRSNWCAT